MYGLTFEDHAGNEASIVPEHGGVRVLLMQQAAVVLTRDDIDALIRFLVDLPTPPDPWQPTTARVAVDAVAEHAAATQPARHDPF